MIKFSTQCSVYQGKSPLCRSKMKMSSPRRRGATPNDGTMPFRERHKAHKKTTKIKKIIKITKLIHYPTDKEEKWED